MNPPRPLPEADIEHVIEHARSAFEALRGGRVFLTGGTGFFGKWLIESFVGAHRSLSLDSRLTVLSRDPEAFLAAMPHLRGERSIEFVQGDVRSFEFPSGSFTHIIHAATPASAKLNAEAPQEMLTTIVEGTRRVLALSALQPAPPRLLLTSSGAVYGLQPSHLSALSETDRTHAEPQDPPSAYAEGKRAAERLCLEAQTRGLCLPVIARAFAFVGPYLPLDQHFAIGNFIRDARAGGPIRVQGDGTPYRSYLYGADLAAWLWILLARGQGGRAYNVGSDRALTIAEVAAAVAGVYGCPVQIAQGPKPGQPAARYIPSIDRARNELGLDVWIDLNQALTRTETFLKEAGR